ncbi:hypothetical protein Vadar_022596 [Vaccinium darrowii]|uniref:Uncharacterized protein n=1 Tax=Vaccinium darrowii TaxID=229202 RepID=A0ACB7YF79_9ERIC|nr:hypothetical protein Vadar_022596 [Vaccinium darrowii]
MRKWTRMKENGDWIKETERTTGEVRRERVAEATRGPKRSQAGPMARREKMEPAKEAMPALPMSEEERWRSERMREKRGGDGEGGEEVGEEGEPGEASMGGGEREKRRNWVALWSESTGRENWGLDGTSGSMVLAALQGCRVGGGLYSLDREEKRE